MDVNQLLDEVQKLLNSGSVNANGLKSWNIESSSDSIKYVKYSFKH